MAQSEIGTKIKPNLSLKEPPLFKVIYINDDQTSMEFVAGSLIEYFNYKLETAAKITTDIHEHGSAVVAILPHEIAEQRCIEIQQDAREQGYPLKVIIEPEI